VTRKPTPATPTPAELERERSVALGLSLDMAILTVLFIVALVGGSLTILAESIRGALMNSAEGLALLVMRRIHRGTVRGMEYGTGKLEQAANLAIGVALIGGALWVALGAIRLLDGEAPPGTPLGLALGAIVGAINCYINFIGWDAVRRAARSGHSLIMQGQLRARAVKLVSSFLVQVALTVAALSTDNIVVAIADAAGSLVVSIVMTVTGLRMVLAAVPDIIDRAPGPTVRGAVERALARQPAAEAALGRLRARRSGGTVFVELTLTFDPALTVAEVQLRIAALRDIVRAELPQADVAIQLG
jgi:divalent metal cation (Fe/Co/Zn/Cd) transporter